MRLLTTASTLKALWVITLATSLSGYGVSACANDIGQANNVKTTSNAHNNTEYLLLKALDKTKSLQKKYGTFITYGAALFPDGKVKFIWYGQPSSDTPQSNNAIVFIRRVLQKQAESGRIIASAVVYEHHRKNTKHPQLNIELEYYNGLAEIFSTELIVKENKELNWGRSVRKSHEAQIFNPLENIRGDS